MTENDQRQAARASFHGRGLTETQFEKAWAISAILRAEIQEKGTFRDALTDFSHAFARDERFDALRGEAILRDVAEGRYGQKLDAYRKELDATRDALPEAARSIALVYAESIGAMIQGVPPQPFYRAQDRAAVKMSEELGVTQIAAKRLMAETFEAHHGKDLYTHAKALEKTHYQPVREAEIAARKAERLQAHSPIQSMG